MSELRTARWYAGNDKDTYIHRAWMRRGLPDSAFSGRPHIAIANTASELSPCNLHLDEVSDHVKRGVWEGGGVPLDLPAVSLGENQILPTAMFLRNLAAMTAEELFRGNPIDGLVLLGGCDKTIPSLVMAAASVDIPALVVPGGPMLTGTFRGKAIGCGTGVWQMSEDLRAGVMTQEDFTASEKSMIRSKGHCNTMGTASTMGVMAEALGLTIPGIAGTPAADSRLLEQAHESGRLAVELVSVGRRPSDVMTRGSFLNAIVALAATGGSTNAVVHLLAMAGRVGVDLRLDDFDKTGSHVPLLANLQPSGEYLMEDLWRAGGLLAVLKEVRELLDDEAITVTGRTLVEELDGAEIYDADVIRSRDTPILANAGIAILRGNLAPNGAVIKPAAAEQHLLKHRGRALVFESIEDMKARLDDPDLDVDEDSVLILRGCGPKGYPGMAEVGNLPIPGKLVKQGVRDMVRISDGRMSGTAYGAVVLHVSPEAADGGPLSKVRTGDPIVLDVEERRLDVDIPNEELLSRPGSEAAAGAYATADRGWQKLYIDHVMQAHLGADLDFLVGKSGHEVKRESH